MFLFAKMFFTDWIQTSNLMCSTTCPWNRLNTDAGQGAVCKIWLNRFSKSSLRLMLPIQYGENSNPLIAFNIICWNNVSPRLTSPKLTFVFWKRVKVSTFKRLNINHNAVWIFRINDNDFGWISHYPEDYARVVVSCDNGVCDGGALVPSPPSMIHLEKGPRHLRHNTFKIISHNPHSTNFTHLPFSKS